MPRTVQVTYPWNSQVLGAEDLTEIAELAVSLPGNWRYEPDVALSPSNEPFVWIYPADHDLALSIGFGKRNGRIAVTIRHKSSRRIQPPTLHATVRAAFIPLWEGLGMLQTRRGRRRRIWRVVCAIAGCLLFLPAALIALR